MMHKKSLNLGQNFKSECVSSILTLKEKGFFKLKKKENISASWQSKWTSPDKICDSWYVIRKMGFFQLKIGQLACREGAIVSIVRRVLGGNESTS